MVSTAEVCVLLDACCGAIPGVHDDLRCTHSQSSEFMR